MMMRKKATRFAFTLLLMLVLAACAPVAPGGSAPGSAPTPGASAEGAMSSTTPMAQQSAPTAGHGSMAMDDTAFDVMFIDSMIEHHQGAIAMAQQAQKESQRPEIQQMAEMVIRDQQREVEQMQNLRKEWYPNVAPTTGMGMPMGDMQVSSDASIPFDQRFITAMIAHHEGAVEMAKEAQAKAEHPEIKQLAENIIAAQEKEIQEMQGWSQEWFGK
jgi:uncharacterized protein (DUF305 family)